MPRGNYQAICNIDRERLVIAFVEGRDYQAAARNLNIARQTARNIAVHFNTTGRVERRPRGGARQPKIDGEMVDYLIGKIEAKPTSTLQDQMQVDMQNKPAVSHQAISKKLDGLLYTVKDIREVPIQWNIPEVKVERRQFANWLMGDGLHVHKVFIDEFGANVWTARTKGKAPVGQRAVRIVEGQRGQNVTICLAISPLAGLVHSTVFAGGMTRERFSGFLMELAEFMRFFDEDYVAICDNVPSNRQVPNFGEQGTLRYLPRYSPFINACEIAGSCLKAVVKQRLVEPGVQREIYDRVASQDETLYNRRIRIVSREMDNALPVLTVHKCAAFVNHIMRYMPACIREEDVFV